MTSLYESSIPVLGNILEAESSLLKKAEAYATEKGIPMSELLETRIYEDMLPLHAQIRLTANVTRRAIGQLTGKQLSDVEDKDRNLTECLAVIDENLKLLADVKPESLSVKESDNVTLLLPSKNIPLPAIGFIQEYTIPNVFFHLSITYAILRMKGVPLGKADYCRSFFKSFQV
ncbi:hypothetical protein F5X99DRAFT_411408 [Biscogniauxia marginata]|nr:hypothetical protein F5X99DRAFT_411408 [Biscogniauxia marginata]